MLTNIERGNVTPVAVSVCFHGNADKTAWFITNLQVIYLSSRVAFYCALAEIILYLFLPFHCVFACISSVKVVYSACVEI